MADRQGLDSKEHFQPLEKTIPTYIKKALYLATSHQTRLPQLNCNLPQTLSQKPGPWPAAREPPTSFCPILIEP